jgi:glucan phosphoethanolaminetransferase (alkaline phosphatase superfamily)
MARQRLPLGVGADGAFTRRGVVFACALGTIAVFLFFPLGILGIVLSSMGMNRVSTKPEAARKLVAWSWAIWAVMDSILFLGVVAALISRS